MVNELGHNNRGDKAYRNVTVFRYDYWLLLTVLVILSLGFLVLTSASIGISDQYYHGPLRFIFHQGIYLISGIFLALVIMRLPINLWQRIGGYLLLITFILLCLVLVPGIGKEINGSVRWLGVGPLTLQASELAKCGVVIYMAGYLVRREKEVQAQLSGFIKPMLIVALISILLLAEPDFGAMVVIVCAILGMIFLAGARLWQFFLLLATAGLALGGLALSSPYRLARMVSFLNPWATPYDSGYQLTQSLIAFGRGGFWGVGLGNSVQKLFYLPEAHTDFLFAILAEEFGMFGQFLVLGLFTLLVARVLYLGKLAYQLNEKFTAYLTYGLGLLLGLQVIINIGVNMGILPTKGLTLPFMSYGGSSMLFSCAIMAILLRVYHEIRLKQDATH